MRTPYVGLIFLISLPSWGTLGTDQRWTEVSFRHPFHHRPVGVMGKEIKGEASIRCLGLQQSQNWESGLPASPSPSICPLWWAGKSGITDQLLPQWKERQKLGKNGFPMRLLSSLTPSWHPQPAHSAGTLLCLPPLTQDSCGTWSLCHFWPVFLLESLPPPAVCCQCLLDPVPLPKQLFLLHSFFFLPCDGRFLLCLLLSPQWSHSLPRAYGWFPDFYPRCHPLFQASDSCR